MEDKGDVVKSDASKPRVVKNLSGTGAESEVDSQSGEVSVTAICSEGRAESSTESLPKMSSVRKKEEEMSSEKETFY